MARIRAAKTDRIIELRRQGLEVNAICLRVGESRKKVTHALRQAGLSTDDRLLVNGPLKGKANLPEFYEKGRVGISFGKHSRRKS